MVLCAPEKNEWQNIHRQEYYSCPTFTDWKTILPPQTRRYIQYSCLTFTAWETIHVWPSQTGRPFSIQVLPSQPGRPFMSNLHRLGDHSVFKSYRHSLEDYSCLTFTDWKTIQYSSLTFTAWETIHVWPSQTGRPFSIHVVPSQLGRLFMSNLHRLGDYSCLTFTDWVVNKLISWSARTQYVPRVLMQKWQWRWGELQKSVAAII